MELKCKIVFDEEKLQELVERAVIDLIERGYIWRDVEPEEVAEAKEKPFTWNNFYKDQ